MFPFYYFRWNVRIKKDYCIQVMESSSGRTRYLFHCINEEGECYQFISPTLPLNSDEEAFVSGVMASKLWLSMLLFVSSLEERRDMDRYVYLDEDIFIQFKNLIPRPWNYKSLRTNWRLVVDSNEYTHMRNGNTFRTILIDDSC